MSRQLLLVVLLGSLASALSFRAGVTPSSIVTARARVQMMAPKASALQPNKMSKKALKEKLKAAGLKMTGKKKDLIVRLEQSLVNVAQQAKADVADVAEIPESYDPSAEAREVAAKAKADAEAKAEAAAKAKAEAGAQAEAWAKGLQNNTLKHNTHHYCTQNNIGRQRRRETTCK